MFAHIDTAVRCAAVGVGGASAGALEFVVDLEADVVVWRALEALVRAALSEAGTGFEVVVEVGADIVVGTVFVGVIGVGSGAHGKALLALLDLGAHRVAGAVAVACAGDHAATAMGEDATIALVAAVRMLRAGPAGGTGGDAALIFADQIAITILF